MSISMKIASLLIFARNFLCVLIAITAAGGIATPAFSAGLDLKGVPAVKEFPPIAAADIKAKMKKSKEIKPYNLDELSYEILLPKDWTDSIQQAPVTGANDKNFLSNNVLSMVAKYVGPPKNLVRSHLTIEALQLPYDISARNWLVNYVVRNGFTMSAMTEKSPYEIEARYVQFDRDQTYAVRVRALINGPKLILVRYYLPQENEKEEEALQGQIVSSFRLLNMGQQGVEKLEEYGFLDQSFFNYPASWELKERNILSIERMSALLFQSKRDENDVVTLDGHIKINVISKLLKTTLAQEIETFRSNLVIKDYSVGKLIETISYKYHPTIKSGKAQIYQLVPSQPNTMQYYEFLVAVMEGADYYYIVSMISPSRDIDFYTWAQNIEVARIIVESVRRDNFSTEIDLNDPYYDYLKE